MSASFDPNDPGIGVPDLGEPPLPDPDAPSDEPFPGEEKDPNWTDDAESGGV